MALQGCLRKMKTEFHDPVNYYFRTESTDPFLLNEFLDKPLKLSWTGRITCVGCGRSIRKSYMQGFCFNCFSNAPDAAECIIRPELCRAHEGAGRDVEWEQEHHNCEHFVYLSLTSDVKIGVTRSSNRFSRWADQGAGSAMVFAKTPYRQLAGLIEVEIKQYVTDRTDWRKMLTNTTTNERSLVELKAMLGSFLPQNLQPYFLPGEEVYHFHYPVLAYPEKVESIDLDKTREAAGILTGIRGQYLLFDGGRVINLRKYCGYEVVLDKI